MRKNTSEGRAGIRQIAKALDLSVGTVDRALHDRAGVNAKTRDRVLKMARKLNYSPNLAARHLRLNRCFRIGVFLPEQIVSFFDPLKAGISAAARGDIGTNVEVVFHSYPRLGEGDVDAMEEHNWRQFDGIILAPGDPLRLNPICASAQLERKPLVFVSTDAKRVHRLSSVAIEASVSGAIAAELLGQIIPEPKPVVILTGDLNIQNHAEKIRGFAAALATLSPHLTLLATVETHESPENARHATLQLLKNQPELGGIYISTANSIPVMEVLEQSGHFAKVKVIATDLFPEMSTWIETGRIFATLHQRPFTQGRMAFEILSRYLIAGLTPKRNIRLAPHVVLKSNLALFLDDPAPQEQEPQPNSVE
jgi:LacI family transcriptional regulator